MSGNSRNHRIAVGAAFAAAILASTPTARADDMQISIDGLDPAAAAAAPSDLDPLEDLYGVNWWTQPLDSVLGSASFDASVDAYQAGLGWDDPFSIATTFIDPSAFSGYVNSPFDGVPTDPLGDLATMLDYSLFLGGATGPEDQAILNLLELPALFLLPLAGFFA
jgi:hypothetical protein